MENNEILSTGELTKALKELTEAIKALATRVEKLERADYHCAPEEHYHDEYANIDHVERSESSFNHEIYQLKNDLNNLEYRCSDIERKAERAQSAADDARRSARGGW